MNVLKENLLSIFCVSGYTYLVNLTTMVRNSCFARSDSLLTAFLIGALVVLFTVIEDNVIIYEYYLFLINYNFIISTF